jgi:hypothetical protein
MERTQVLAVLLILMAVGACAPGPEDEPLTILSPWPAEQLPAAGAGIGPVRWVRLPADRFADWLEAGRPADVLLGGDDRVYLDLEARGLMHGKYGFSPVRVSYVSLRGSVTGDAGPKDWAELARNDVTWSMTLGDPRSDLAVRAWIARRLDRPDWAAGHAELVRAAAQADLAGVDWPEMGPGRLALAVVPNSGVTGPFDHPRPVVQAEENIGFPASCEHPDRARAWIKSWTGRGMGELPAPGITPLAADLFGSTLIDAHPELRNAWGALLRAGRPAEWEARLVQPPPWPPAEVLRLRDEPGGRENLDTLAAALVADPEARDWLVASWEGPRGMVDHGLLEGLSTAAGGKLVREPRFRSWLRAEWAAWARQWYRWIARRAEYPAPASPEPFPDREPGA